MKVFYDEVRDNIMLGAENRYFANGSLEAVILDPLSDNIAIRYYGSTKNELYMPYSVFKKEDGSDAGLTIADVVIYLNNEFNKTSARGEGEFNLLDDATTITDSRITETSNIILATKIPLNEHLSVTTVGDGYFIVTRTVINVLLGLTSGLNFTWKKI